MLLLHERNPAIRREKNLKLLDRRFKTFKKDETTMERYTWESPKNGVTNRDRPKSKSSRKGFLRYVFSFAALMMFLPLFYVNLNVATIDIRNQAPVAVKKKLEGFLEFPSPKDLDVPFSGDSDVQAKNRSAGVDSSAPFFGDSNVPTKNRSSGFASLFDHKNDEENLVLTAYLEPPEALVETENEHNPLVRNTSISRLRSISFPNASNCATLMQNFPVDDFPQNDPFLPWIHDYFPSADGRSLQFVAQNKRKCDTGVENVEKMKFWKPQVALFQGIPIVVESKDKTGKDNTIYRLATSFQEATHNSTRFQCRFHRGNTTVTTLSYFNFDYEFINWIKGIKKMFEANGERDASTFWLNQLVFRCPIPEIFQPLLSSSSSASDLSEHKAKNTQPAFHVDLIPIRTPTRSDYLFLSREDGTADETLGKLFGKKHILPPMDDAGRWQNLPVCRRSDALLSSSGRGDRDQIHNLPSTDTTNGKEKPYRLVACTWTSSAYQRRGESFRISDSSQRLREWIQFHLMVGVDHIYVYDNTDTTGNGKSSSLYDVTQSFGSDQVTYHAWPCKICNNVRPYISCRRTIQISTR